MGIKKDGRGPIYDHGWPAQPFLPGPIPDRLRKPLPRPWPPRRRPPWIFPRPGRYQDRMMRPPLDRWRTRPGAGGFYPMLIQPAQWNDPSYVPLFGAGVTAPQPQQPGQPQPQEPGQQQGGQQTWGIPDWMKWSGQAEGPGMQGYMPTPYWQQAQEAYQRSPQEFEQWRSGIEAPYTPGTQQYQQRTAEAERARRRADIVDR